MILLSDLTTRMSRMRIATPDHKPFTIDLDSLATRVSDPAVTLRDAVGRVQLRGDSAVFSLSEGHSPAPDSPAAARLPGRTTRCSSTSR